MIQSTKPMPIQGANDSGILPPMFLRVIRLPSFWIPLAVGLTVWFLYSLFAMPFDMQRIHDSIPRRHYGWPFGGLEYLPQSESIRFAFVVAQLNRLIKTWVIGSAMFMALRIYATIRDQRRHFGLANLLGIMTVVGIIFGLLSDEPLRFNLPPWCASCHATVYVMQLDSRILHPLALPLLFAWAAGFYCGGLTTIWAYRFLRSEFVRLRQAQARRLRSTAAGGFS